MPDISMCDNQTCPSRLRCYRFTATPNPFRQSYVIGLAPKEGEDKCEEFWDNSEYKKEGEGAKGGMK